MRLTKHVARSLLVACGFLAAAPAVPLAAAAAEGYAYYVAGDPKVPAPGVRVPGLALLGGPPNELYEGHEPPPPEVDAAFTWLVNRSGRGHVVVIGTSNTDEHCTYLYRHLPPPHPVSVETLVFKTRDAASERFVVQTIRNADALFIKGGDQSEYLRLWHGTAVLDAIRHVAGKGAPIGGSSAGLAVLGEFSFSAREEFLYSPLALANPYDKHVTLERDFLGLSRLELSPYRFLRQVLTESHFSDRGRMGRHVTLLARIVQDGWEKQAKGLAVDEMTAVLIEADGSATVVDHRPPDKRGAAYFFVTPGPPEVCRRGVPLTYQNLSAYRIRASDAGAGFNLATWTGTGGTPLTVSVEQGILRAP
jgi:cyanophycinase